MVIEMCKKLYLYAYDKPSIKIAWTIIAVLFSSIVLFSPAAEFTLKERLFTAFWTGIFPLLFVYLILYWTTAGDKKASVRFINLKTYCSNLTSLPPCPASITMVYNAFGELAAPTA